MNLLAVGVESAVNLISCLDPDEQPSRLLQVRRIKLVEVATTQALANSVHLPDASCMCTDVSASVHADFADPIPNKT